jgi:hypothetical protein
MKVKPPSHQFRVSTDQVRQEYRRGRTAELAPQIERRQQLAAELAAGAAVTIERDQGYVVCGPDMFDDVAEIVRAARAVAQDVDLDAKKAEANKPFMVKLVEKNVLTLDSPLLRFALRRDIVASAAAYLGVVPILQFANVMFSSHAAADPAKSQLYHCDSDEAEQVKVFILCEEVTADNGPLTFVPAWQSQVVRDTVQYKYKTRLTDGEVREAAQGPLEEVMLAGGPGTMAFLDTSRCLHYGSRFRDTSARRLLVMLQYITPMAFILPEKFREGATFRRLAKDPTDEMTAMVLGDA